MKKSKLKNKQNFNIMKLTPFIIIIVIVMLTIGYSSVAAILAVNTPIAIIRVDRNIRVTGVSASNPISNANSSYVDYYENGITGSLSLPSSNSEITYDIVITNFGNVEMGIFSVTGLPENLTYEINNYTLEDALCDDNNPTKCKLASISTLHVKIKYAENGFDNNNTDYLFNFGFYFAAIDWVATIGETSYESLQKAVNAVPTDGTETYIQLIKNTTELINVAAGKNIVLDLQNYTVKSITRSGTNGNPVMEVYGSVKMSSGTILCDSTQGAINVKSTGTFTITGGKILATDTKQAIYNDGGKVTIGGSAYLSNTSVDRATVHNHANAGTMTIIGGTIISENYSGVYNEAGTLIIGNKDGTVSTTSPYIQGTTYGVYNFNGKGSSTPFKYYDGIIKGRDGAIYDDMNIPDKENLYHIEYGSQVIGSATYTTAILARSLVVTFYPEGGTVSETERGIESGGTIGNLPTPTRRNYAFDGWFTYEGDEVSASTTIYDDIDLYAHWTHINDTFIALIGTEEFDSLAEAIRYASTISGATIELARNTSENVTVPSGANIVFDFKTFTLHSPNQAAAIVNNGTCRIISGTITTSSTKTSAVDNSATGNFTISGGSIVASGQRQALYNDGGKVLITGTAYLETVTNQRAAVQNNTAGGTVTITGGTIIAPNFAAVNNVAGTTTIGTDDSIVNSTSPLLIGKTYGITNAADLYYYDGKIMGRTGSINGSITNPIPSRVDTTEQYEGNTYQVTYLE